MTKLLGKNLTNQFRKQSDMKISQETIITIKNGKNLSKLRNGKAPEQDKIRKEPLKYVGESPIEQCRV